MVLIALICSLGSVFLWSWFELLLLVGSKEQLWHSLLKLPTSFPQTSNNQSKYKKTSLSNIFRNNSKEEATKTTLF